MAVNLVNKDQVELTLRFRVFDDGVGFRYEYNVPAADSLLITDELHIGLHQLHRIVNSQTGRHRSAP